MANLSAASISGAKTAESNFIKLTRKGGSTIKVNKDLFKAYHQAENVEGFDSVELKNGVIVNVIESSAKGQLVIGGSKKNSEGQITDIAGNSMQIEVDARNKKVDYINISPKIVADVKIEAEDNVSNGNLFVSVPATDSAENNK